MPRAPREPLSVKTGAPGQIHVGADAHLTSGDENQPLESRYGLVPVVARWSLVSQDRRRWSRRRESMGGPHDKADQRRASLLHWRRLYRWMGPWPGSRTSLCGFGGRVRW